MRVRNRCRFHTPGVQPFAMGRARARLPIWFGITGALLRLVLVAELRRSGIHYTFAPSTLHDPVSLWLAEHVVAVFYDQRRFFPGPQETALKPGRYRLNHFLFDVRAGPQTTATGIPAGQVGVVKSNVTTPSPTRKSRAATELRRPRCGKRGRKTWPTSRRR